MPSEKGWVKKSTYPRVVEQPEQMKASFVSLPLPLPAMVLQATWRSRAPLWQWSRAVWKRMGKKIRVLFGVQSGNLFASFSLVLYLLLTATSPLDKYSYSLLHCGFDFRSNWKSSTRIFLLFLLNLQLGPDGGDSTCPCCGNLRSFCIGTHLQTQVAFA